jgi:hypothetical protein
MVKKKIVAIHKPTYFRLKKERKCFDPEHPKRIEALAKSAEIAGKRTSDLETANSDLLVKMSRMVDKELLEEAEKTAYSKGLHDGCEDREAMLKSHKTCFNGMHKALDNGRLMVLDFSQIISLYEQMRERSMLSNTIKMQVMVPEGINLDGSQTVKSIQDMLGKIIGRMMRGG